MRGVFTKFLNDDDPTTFKTITFGNVAEGADGIVFADGYLGHTIRTGTYQSTADGGVTLTSGNDYNAAFLADDSGANIGASVRNLLGRTLLTFDQSAGSIRSVMGQLKMLTGIDVATGVYTAVQGYLELAGTHAVSSGATLSGMDVSIEFGGTVTVASGGVLAGLRIETTGTGTIAGAGETAAIYIEDSGTVTDWPVGVDINNCTIGIDIGAATTGINVSGATTTGILLAGTATDGISITGICTDAIHISGANTATGLHISGDQVVGTLFATTAAADAAHRVTIPTGITLGAGVDINATSTGVVTSGLTMQGTGTFTTGITLSATAITTGILISATTVTTGITISSACSGDGILISGASADGIHVSGATTANAIHVSGDQVVGFLFETTAAADAAHRITVPTGITLGAGVDMNCTSTGVVTSGLTMQGTGTFTTGITLSATAITTGILISATTVTTGITISSACSGDGLLISGASADGIHISGATTANAIHVSGDQVIGFLFETTAAADAAHRVTVPTGITLGAGLDINCTSTGVVTSGLTMQGTGTFTTGITLSASAITTGILLSAGAMTDGILISGTTPADGIHISSACSANGIHLAGATAVNNIYIGHVQTNAATGLQFIAAYAGSSIVTGTYQSTADGGVILTSTNDYNAAFLCDDSGDNIGASVRNVLGRTLLTVDQSGGSIRSLMGQLKMLTDVDLATGVYAGVQGYLEFVAGNDVQAGGKVAGIDSSIEVADGATLVVDASGRLCGLHCELTAGDGGTGIVTQTGDCAAIWIDTAGTITDWKVGIDINNTTTGIDIGACTTGINVSGTVTTGIAIAGASTHGIYITGASATAGIGITQTLAANDDHALEVITTTAATGNSVRPIHMVSTLTGPGAVGGRAEFEMTSNVALGGWANALKGYFNMGNSCSVSGLGSAIVAEMLLPGASLAGVGSYGVLEIELVTQANGLTGGAPVAFQWMQVSGNSTATADWEDTGYLMIIKGLNEGTGNIYSAGADVIAAATLRILVGTTPYYLMLAAGESN